MEEPIGYSIVAARDHDVRHFFDGDLKRLSECVPGALECSTIPAAPEAGPILAIHQLLRVDSAVRDRLGVDEQRDDLEGRGKDIETVRVPVSFPTATQMLDGDRAVRWVSRTVGGSMRVVGCTPWSSCMNSDGSAKKMICAILTLLYSELGILAH